MSKQLKIDGTKNDIRLMISGLNDSPDAGLVEGVPIDPPDESPGWELVALWVEHDTIEEKVDVPIIPTEKPEKGKDRPVRKRLVDPAIYQLWVRPKSKAKAKANPKAEKPAAPKEPRAPRGRKPKNAAPPAPPEEPKSEGADAGA